MLYGGSLDHSHDPLIVGDFDERVFSSLLVRNHSDQIFESFAVFGFSGPVGKCGVFILSLPAK